MRLTTVAMSGLALAACGPGSPAATPPGTSSTDPPTITTTVTQPVTAGPVSVLSTSPGHEPHQSLILGGTDSYARSDPLCVTPPAGPSRDVAYAGVRWEADDDLASVRFRASSFGGARVVGRPLSVPLRSFYDHPRLPWFLPWSLRDTLALNHHLDWARRRPAGQIAPRAGDTGVLVFRLRLSPRFLRGTSAYALGEVRATLVTAEGRRTSTGLTMESENYRVAGSGTC